MNGEVLRLPALEIRQGPRRVLYSFAVDGKMLPQFTTIARAARADFQDIRGYQRPEVLSHIAEIRAYLESADPMIPNALVVAFDERVSFEPARGGSAGGVSRPGTLVIPLPGGRPDAERPGWIVDGQQRAAAIREARVANFPVCVIGFIAASAQEQREQFILVNNVKPLPKGLVYELLPVTETTLPGALLRRRFPALLLDRLNRDEDSPLRGAIRTPTVPGGRIKDNSLLKLIENSLSDGVLYRFRGAGAGGNAEAMLAVLKDFWGAVRDVFPDDWDRKPKQTRLTHGAGVVALGFVMDAIAERHRDGGLPSRAEFVGDLGQLRPVCRWSEGYWEFGPGVQRKWNEIQNTPRDVQVLANYLLVQYKARVWSGGDSQEERTSR
jgi:DGQHR domain-containing protein